MPGEMHEHIIPVTGGKKEEETPKVDILKEMDLREQRMNQMIDSDFRDLKFGLTHVDKIEPKTPKLIEAKEKFREEKIRDVVDRILLSSVMETTSMVEEHLNKNKNPYPYDSRQGEGFYDSWEKNLETLQQDKRVGPEGKLWIKRLQRDIASQEGFFKVMVGMGASAPMYHDVVQQFRTMEAQRNCFDSYDLRSAFSKKLPGLEFEDSSTLGGGLNEIETVKNAKIGFDKSSFAKEGTFIKKKIEEENISNQFKEGVVGLKEISSKWNAESFRWRMVVAAIGQYDPKNQEFGFMKKNLTGDSLEVRLARALFVVGEGKELKNVVDENGVNKKEIEYLNIFSVDEKVMNEEKYFSLMETLLTHDVKNKLNKLANLELNETVTVEAKNRYFNALVSDISAAALWRENHWMDKDRNTFSKLATMIIKSGIVMDRAMMTAKEYSWHFKFITVTDAKGERIPEIRKGKRESGSIYSVWDLPSLYFADRSIRYDEADNARSPILPPSNDSYRYEWSNNPPNYQPSLTDAPIYDDNGKMVPGKEHENYFNKDQYLKELYDSLLASLDTDPRKFFKEKGWRWQTCWWNNPKLKDYFLVMPIFMPQDLSIENFWNSFSSEVNKKILIDKNGVGDPSVFDEIIAGTKTLEDIEWKNVKSKQYDRWLVDMSMLGRYIRFFTESFSSEDPLFSQVMESPSTFGPKKLANYIRLTFRDGKDNPYKFEMSFLPLLMTLATANKFNITSPDAFAKDVNNLSRIDRFIYNMSEWKRAFIFLTSRRSDSLDPDKPEKNFEIRNYGQSMVNITDFYEKILIRMAFSSANESFKKVQDDHEKTVGWLEQHKDVFKMGDIPIDFKKNYPSHYN